MASLRIASRSCASVCCFSTKHGRPPGARHLRNNMSEARTILSPSTQSCRGSISKRLRCEATAGQEPVYNGVYGAWSLDKQDYIEVYSYRVSLSVTAASLLLGVIVALIPEENTLHSSIVQFLNPACVLGGASFGAALFLIHIYVDPIKRALQALWALGFAGTIYLMVTEAEPVPVFVVEHPFAVWFIGPFFAALTGLAIKEGLCYGKPEAVGLALSLPILLLGHLSGLAPVALEQVLMVAAMGCFATLAARKYSQAVKDDIGDKSVFMFRQLPVEEQQAYLEKRNAGSGDFK